MWAERGVHILDLFPVYSFVMTSESASYGSVMIPHCNIFQCNTSYVSSRWENILLMRELHCLNSPWVEVCAWLDLNYVMLVISYLLYFFYYSEFIKFEQKLEHASVDGKQQWGSNEKMFGGWMIFEICIENMAETSPFIWCSIITTSDQPVTSKYKRCSVP